MELTAFHRSSCRQTARPFGTSEEEPRARALRTWLVFFFGGVSKLGTPPWLGFSGATRHISLSRMTFPHRLARVLLLEQVFRAREIWAASHYPK